MEVEDTQSQTLLNLSRGTDGQKSQPVFSLETSDNTEVGEGLNSHDTNERARHKQFKGQDLSKDQFYNDPAQKSCNPTAPSSLEEIPSSEATNMSISQYSRPRCAVQEDLHNENITQKGTVIVTQEPTVPFYPRNASTLDVDSSGKTNKSDLEFSSSSSICDQDNPEQNQGDTTPKQNHVTLASGQDQNQLILDQNRNNLTPDPNFTPKHDFLPGPANENKATSRLGQNKTKATFHLCSPGPNQGNLLAPSPGQNQGFIPPNSESPDNLPNPEKNQENLTASNPVQKPVSQVLFPTENRYFKKIRIKY